MEISVLGKRTVIGFLVNTGAGITHQSVASGICDLVITRINSSSSSTHICSVLARCPGGKSHQSPPFSINVSWLFKLWISRHALISEQLLSNSNAVERLQ